MKDIMSIKKNKWLAQNMKQHDILPSYRTEGLYVPARKTMADMDDAYLRKQLCHKAGQNMDSCAECAGKCMAARLLLERSAK